MQRTRHAWLFAILAGCASVLTLPARAEACGWDQDTAWVDARYMKDVLAVIIGRFPRNPPLYYEMRLERTKKLLQSQPANLAAYDDAAVACDRLGNPADAIAWMDKKKAQLDALPETDKDKKEHLYRYLSNQGTFYYHKWLKQGAARADLSDVKKAKQLLADAIQLNPNAHFGRERYQVLAMDWILSPKKGLETLDVAIEWEREEAEDKSTWKVIPGFIKEFNKTVYTEAPERKKYADAVRGLAGLIALGSSWENVDVFHNLALALRLLEQRTALSAAASLRAWELLAQGKKTLYPYVPAQYAQDVKPIVGFAMEKYRFEPRSWSEIQERFGKLSKAEYNKLPGKTVIEKQYHLLRAEAEAWNSARGEYLLKRLQTGQHPDTHPDFWTDFAEPALPLLAKAKRDPKLDLLSEFDGEKQAAAPAGAGKKL